MKMKELSGKIKVDTAVLREEMKRTALSEKILRPMTAKGGAKQPEKKNWIKPGRDQNLKEQLWSLFLKYPKLILAYSSYLHKDMFAEMPYFALYEQAERQYTTGKIELEPIRNSLAGGETENPVDILLLKAEKDYADFSEGEANKEAEILLSEIKKEWTKNKRQALTAELLKAQDEKNFEKAGQILKEMMLLGV